MKRRSAISSYGRHLVDERDIQAVTRVLASDWLTQGPTVPAFEAALASYCGVKYAIAVSSGTAALHLAYLAAGIGPGDEVITTPNTFVATANMLLAVGARPVFVDIRSDTLNMDERSIESLITKKTKAIVPVHFGGNPCDMQIVLQIARKHNLWVIEDACHALGATYHNEKIGALKSDMTVFSFHPVKPITTGEGGAIVTRDRTLAHKLALLRSHGVTKDAQGCNVMTLLGYNYRMTDVQAALGVSQLKKLNRFIKRRRLLARAYARELGRVKSYILPEETDRAQSGWHLYVIRLRDARQRMAVDARLKAAGIGCSFHYPPVYSHPYYRAHGYARTVCPRADAYWTHCLTVPLHPGLSISDIRCIAGELRAFSERKRYE